MPSSAADRNKLALDMRVIARHLFEHALAEASIDRAFQKQVDCDKGVLRMGEDLYARLHNRVLVISTARRRMPWSIRLKCGRQPRWHRGQFCRSGFAGTRLPLFSRSHPAQPGIGPRRQAILKSLNAQDAFAAIFLLVAEARRSQAGLSEISLKT
jgi:hypothetical protein